MSILQKIFHSKNSAGNYDEYHFKTDAEVVMMSKDSSEPISTGKILLDQWKRDLTDWNWPGEAWRKMRSV